MLTSLVARTCSQGRLQLILSLEELKPFLADPEARIPRPLRNACAPDCEFHFRGEKQAHPVPGRVAMSSAVYKAVRAYDAGSTIESGASATDRTPPPCKSWFQRGWML